MTFVAGIQQQFTGMNEWHHFLDSNFYPNIACGVNLWSKVIWNPETICFLNMEHFENAPIQILRTAIWTKIFTFFFQFGTASLDRWKETEWLWPESEWTSCLTIDQMTYNLAS